MTLDIRKYLENLINKEAVVSHFSVKVSAGKADKIKGAIAAKIKDEYGELFLDDADYVLFFTKKDGWTSKDIKKVFELTDRALGKDANKLSKADFIKLVDNSKLSEDPDASDIPDKQAAAEIPEQPSDEAVTTLFVKITIK